MSFKAKDQIAYIPTHANSDIKHSDVELGFVTSVALSGDLFCRYWSKHSAGELRTKANSECTPKDMVVHHKSISETSLEAAWDKYVAD